MAARKRAKEKEPDQSKEPEIDGEIYDAGKCDLCDEPATMLTRPAILKPAEPGDVYETYEPGPLQRRCSAHEEPSGGVEAMSEATTAKDQEKDKEPEQVIDGEIDGVQTPNPISDPSQMEPAKK